MMVVDVKILISRWRSESKALSSCVITGASACACASAVESTAVGDSSSIVDIVVAVIFLGC